ncbi:MAG: glycosyltransferase family 2 protein [Acidimicrobiia bacterium]
MTGRPKVSIVTATLNAMPALQRTVSSVAGQTFTDYEHIVIDGGSTDGTRPWLEREGPALRWVSEPDSGIAEALNKGIDLALGEWVLVLNADDTFAGSESLSFAQTSLETSADVVCFDVLFTARDRRRRLKSHAFSSRINFKPFPHQGAFTRRSLFDRYGKFDTDLSVHMDYEFFLRTFRGGARAVATGEVLSEMPDTGISSRRDWESLRARFGEERAIHLRHCPSAYWRLVYSGYWPGYLLYRRARSWVSSR